jgi:hypothetical protein
MTCQNPCKDYLLGGCGNPECTSRCHQPPEFYGDYTPEIERKIRRKKVILEEIERLNKELKTLC